MKKLLIAVSALTLAAPASAQLAAPNDAGVTFAHVHLNVADVEVHKQLWSEQFGGEVIQKGPLTTVKFPGFFIILTEREPTGGSQGTALDHFGFKVRDIDAAHERWRAAGYEIQAEFTGVEGARNSYLLGPDGVRFELQEDRGLSQEIIGYHVHFLSTDFESLLDWYVDVVGAVRQARGRLETAADVPGMNLSFQTCRAECVPTRGRAIDHIGFEVDDLDAFAEVLAAKGVELEFPPRYIESIGLKITFFTDPSGVRVELTEGLDLY